jgi:urease accessory protein
MQRAAGRSRVVFGERQGVTFLDRLYQEGAAKVRLPRPTGATREAVLINTAGGLTGGDSFATEVTLRPRSRAVVTTQACERIYRSAGGEANVSANVEVGGGGRLCWLPQETILFDGGRLSRRFEADLAGDAELLALEAVIFGRDAMGETVETGFFRDRWRVRRDGVLLFADDLRFDGEMASLLARPAVLNGNRAMATALLVAPDCERLLDAVRDALGTAGGASAWNGKLLVRIVAAEGFTLRRALIPVLTVLTGGRALPKIWQI